MSKKKLLVGISIAVGLVVVIGVLIATLGSRGGLVKTPGVPRSESFRAISVDDAGPGMKLVENQYDGYRITVPSGWLVEEIASKRGGLKVFYQEGSVGIPDEFDPLDGGLLLNVITLEDIKDARLHFPPSAVFVETQVDERVVYRAEYPILREDIVGADYELVTVPVPNSLVVGYIFQDHPRDYLVFCTSAGVNFRDLAQQCQEQVLTFEIIKD